MNREPNRMITSITAECRTEFLRRTSNRATPANCTAVPVISMWGSEAASKRLRSPHASEWFPILPAA